MLHDKVDMRGRNLKEFIPDSIFYFKLETWLYVKTEKLDIYI